MLIDNLISYFRDASISFRRASSFFGPAAGMNWFRLVAVGAMSGILSIGGIAQTLSTYVQTNTISDGGAGSVAAQVTDPTLINPWGVSVGPAIWIDKAGSGSVAIDTAAGAIAVPSLPSVTIPAATSAHGSPSGTVYNNAGIGFDLPGGSLALFIFGTLDGTIAAWNATSGTQAVTVVNNSAKASYTDIVLDTNASGTFLLAANFKQGTVDVFDSTFAAHALTSSFTDPTLPSGYSPFGIHSIGGNIYVTYAQVNATTGESVGAGLGYVNEFDSNGKFIARVASESVLNAPWGMALAPQGFGSYGGDLLIGNFGDGVINAFDPKTFALIGSLNTSSGTPIANIGLWEIFFGQNSGQTATLGDPNTLYFAAGINGEKGGLFGSIAVAPVTPVTGSFSLLASANTVNVAAGQTAGSVILSLAATNGFSGPVTFSCTPTSVTCTFSPSTVMLSGSGTTSVTVAIASVAPVAAPPTTGGGYSRFAANQPFHLLRSRTSLTLALIGPVGLLAFARLKRRSLLAGGSLFVLLLVTATAITGCSASTNTQQAASATPATPATTQVTVNAISGSITQSVMVTLTVQ
jgi:uncharacterized protein (TIGR03118 family)